MSLLTVRIPIAPLAPLDVRLLPIVEAEDRTRVQEAQRVRGLRVVSTELPDQAPFLWSIEIEATGAPTPAEAVGHRVATLANQVRPDQPRQNIVDCRLTPGELLGGGIDWTVKAARPAPSVGVVVTFLLTLDDDSAQCPP